MIYSNLIHSNPIDELRKKFVLINMLLVFLVLLVVFIALCVSTYNQARFESLGILKSALEGRDGFHRQLFKPGQKPRNDFGRYPQFVVAIDRDGRAQLLYSDGVSLDDVVLAEIAGLAAARNGGEGVLDKYGLRYLKRPLYDGTRIAFVDIAPEQEALGRIILISALAMAAALLAFFVISLFLSRWVFRPAERAWEQQRRFVADASHELKTPLTVILANMGILKNNREETVAGLWNWVENTEASAMSMKKLVDNLLFLAKSGDAATPLVHSRINVSDTFLGAVLALESLAFERNITLNTDAISSDVFVNGDEGQLRRLAAILLDNAVKYSESPGTVWVRLSVRQRTAVFSVHNRGEIIPAGDMDHLFERFYRADKSRSNEGYGLGLAIAKSIVELHRGKITVESSGEKGTVFTVTLPRHPFPLRTDGSPPGISQ